MSAHSLDIGKVLQATEIIKTRTPFLHQENKMISTEKEITIKSRKDSEPDHTTMRIFSGIQIVLSRNPLKDADLAGYQKPKPRQFVQPPPRQQKAEVIEHHKPAKDEKKKRQRTKKDTRESSHSDELRTTKKPSDDKQ